MRSSDRSTRGRSTSRTFETTSEFPEGRELARAMGHRTTLGVPMLREGKRWAPSLIRRMEVRPFSDAQIALLQTFADQAVIAIENVRLFTELRGAQPRSHGGARPADGDERDPARHQQLADRHPAGLRRDHARARSACAGPASGPSIGSMARWSTSPASTVATTLPSRSIGASFPCVPSEVCWERARSWTVPSSMCQTYSRTWSIRAKDVARASGWSSAVCVPMLREGTPIGAITISKAEARSVLRRADRAAPDLRRPGRHRHRERAPVHRAPGEQPRADHGAGHADRHQRHPARHQPVADGCPAGVRRDRGQRRPLAGGVHGRADPDRGRSDRARRAHEHRRRRRRRR